MAREDACWRFDSEHGLLQHRHRCICEGTLLSTFSLCYLKRLCKIILFLNFGHNLIDSIKLISCLLNWLRLLSLKNSLFIVYRMETRRGHYSVSKTWKMCSPIWCHTMPSSMRAQKLATFRTSINFGSSSSMIFKNISRRVKSKMHTQLNLLI